MAQPKKKSSLPTLSDGSTLGPKVMASMDALWPNGWQHYFDPCRAGKYIGHRNRCPTCGVTPPKGLKHHQRWKWMAIHQATHKPRLHKS